MRLKQDWGLILHCKKNKYKMSIFNNTSNKHNLKILNNNYKVNSNFQTIRLKKICRLIEINSR